jgi:hypothetical protein
MDRDEEKPGWFSLMLSFRYVDGTFLEVFLLGTPANPAALDDDRT